jgi:hypothetical protein
VLVVLKMQTEVIVFFQPLHLQVVVKAADTTVILEHLEGQAEAVVGRSLLAQQLLVAPEPQIKVLLVEMARSQVVNTEVVVEVALVR